MDSVNGFFYHFFRDSPLLNFADFSIAVISLFICIYFYLKSRKSKRPTYIVRTINLIKENVQINEKIEIRYAGEKVRNLSISKLAFWNNGRDSIKSDDIPSKEPLRISISKDFEILDAEIMYSKNPANNFKLDFLPNKDILLIFEYFAFEEGIILQIFHTGNKSTDILMTGCLKSGDAINNKSLDSEITQTGKMKTIKEIKTEGWIIVLLGMFFILVFYSAITSYLSSLLIGTLLFALLFGLGGLFMIVYGGYKGLKRYIPKGFNIFNEEFLS